MNVEKECTTHHYACDCREANIRRLVKVVRLFRYSQALASYKKLDEALKEWEGEYKE